MFGRRIVRLYKAMLIDVFPICFKLVASMFVGFPAVCLVPFGFRKVRETGSCHVSNFRPNPTAGVRAMNQKTTKLTSIKLTSIQL